MTEILPAADAAELAACEQVIERGLKTFTEVGVALAAIRDARLYRASHATFEDYCRDRWSLSSRHVNRTIEAAKVAGVLGPIGPVPANEAQARELAPLLSDPDELRDTWQRALDSSDGKPTAADVAAARGAQAASEDDGDTFAERCARMRRSAAGWGFPADDEVCAEVAEHMLFRDAARELLRRGGVCPMPPADWAWTKARKPAARPGGRTPVTAATNRLTWERNRLAIWEILVMREAGSFLIFCEKAGIKVGKGITFADQLRYPLEDGDPPLPDDWTAEDEHNAARGRFYTWFYTSDELREMSGAAS